MKIIYPQIEVTIIDSLNKRINFLQVLSEELGLEGVHFTMVVRKTIHDKNFRAQFDLVTARCRSYANLVRADNSIS